MAHPTEEQLGDYAFDPEGAPDRREIETHLADCPACSVSLAFIRSVDAELTDRDAWEIAEHDDSSAREAVRELAARAAAEDEEAERVLEELLPNPARMAWTKLTKQRRYRTAGVVRRLLRAAHDACDREPLDALTFADAAIDIAGDLTAYPAPVLHELRADAWKERANALSLLGRFDASLEALTHADREYRNVPVSPLGPAMVKHARAIVFYERGDLARAMELLTESAKAYAALGEIEHYMRAQHYIANIFYRQQNIGKARAIYEELLAWGEGENDLTWIAREHRTLGHCALQMRDFSAAVQHFHLSVEAFRELGADVEATRSEWGFALVALASGNCREALTRFQTLRGEFHRREMLVDEALVALHMMEALHALDRTAEIVTLAGEVTQTFMQAGMLSSALTGFAYLREGAKRGTLNREAIAHVEQFLRRLEREPSLLFVPLPEPPH
jgi:tetratricopeptide (TPR) repeat protein